MEDVSSLFVTWRISTHSSIYIYQQVIWSLADFHHVNLLQARALLPITAQQRQSLAMRSNTVVLKQHLSSLPRVSFAVLRGGLREFSDHSDGISSQVSSGSSNAGEVALLSTSVEAAAALDAATAQSLPMQHQQARSCAPRRSIKLDVNISMRDLS